MIIAMAKRNVNTPPEYPEEVEGLCILARLITSSMLQTKGDTVGGAKASSIRKKKRKQHKYEDLP